MHFDWERLSQCGVDLTEAGMDHGLDRRRKNAHRCRGFGLDAATEGGNDLIEHLDRELGEHRLDLGEAGV